MKLRVILAVHGRFHAFDLIRELTNQGVDVTLLTNYPKRVVEKFGVPGAQTVTCVSHGVISRALHRAGGRPASKLFEPHLHRWFSRWAAKVVGRMSCNVIHAFSGIAEELFRASKNSGANLTLVRGSAHIRTQARILEEEETRCGTRLDRPSHWMIQRELREYNLASSIFVLSSFAHTSFINQGVAQEKMQLLPLGTELKRFRATPQQIEERCASILSMKPLRVLTIGTFSFRKGVLDLAAIVTAMGGKFRFSFVGSVLPEARALVQEIGDGIQFMPKVPQHELPAAHQRADLFLFPTLEDGYAVVLAQAQAAGLPIMATPNSAAPDMVRENKTGWILPIRDPGSFIEQLRWCDEHRAELAQMVRNSYNAFQPRDWAQVATDFIRIQTKLLQS